MERYFVLQHGENLTVPAIGCVVDGCPPNISLSEKDIQIDMDRRRPGKSKFTSQRKEFDKVEIFIRGIPRKKLLELLFL